VTEEGVVKITWHHTFKI